jgi:spectinomycin phosphotransferase
MFDLAQLIDLLSRQWSLDALSLERIAVGFPGSPHYRAVTPAGEWFVTVHDLSHGRLADGVDATFAALQSALLVARTVRDAGLEFVLAPERDRRGGAIARLSSGLAVSVYPFVAGTSNPGGAHASAAERREVLDYLGRLHELRVIDCARRDSLTIPQRDRLEDAIQSIDLVWNVGPYSDRTRRLLAENADDIRGLLLRYDSLAQEAAKDATSWVMTHGEPHGANVHRATDGRLYLVDWDTALVARRERDLWMVLEADNAADHSAYTASRERYELDSRILALYRLWWDLAEIAEYVDRFRHPHSDSGPDAYAWRDLNDYLPVRAAREAVE